MEACSDGGGPGNDAGPAVHKVPQVLLPLLTEGLGPAVKAKTKRKQAARSPLYIPAKAQSHKGASTGQHEKERNEEHRRPTLSYALLFSWWD